MQMAYVKNVFFRKLLFTLCILCFHQLNGVTSSFNWMELFPADHPSGRLTPMMAYDNKNEQVVLFGGGFSFTRLADTWIWNGSNWVLKSPKTSPSGRTGGVMYFDPKTHQVLLFGGLGGGSSSLNDTWLWDGNDWTQLKPATSPPPRFFAVMAPEPTTGLLLLFGGRTSGGSMNDTWVWDGHTWTELKPHDSPPPTDSAAMSSNPVTDQLILFGGIVSGTFTNDTWLWNGVNWIQQFPTNIPTARGSPYMAFDPVSSQLLLFGGVANPEGSLNDSWFWDGTNWNQQITQKSPSGRGMGVMVTDLAINHPFLFGGSSSTLFTDTWLWVPLPQVTKISPKSGPTTGHTNVKISGSLFTGATSVFFGSNAAPFAVVSDTEIDAISPPGLGTVDVTVTTPSGTSNVNPDDQFTYLGPKPVVISVNPSEGPESGGTNVTISGENFTGVTAVHFGSIAASFDFESDSMILAISPAGTGTVDVTVTTENGTSSITPDDRFTYVTMKTPIVTGINPSEGPESGGTDVTISGENFTGVTAVHFGSTAAFFVFESDNVILASSPAGKGTVDVTVTTPSGTSPITPNDRFTYVSKKTPIVTGINPSQGPESGGTTVTISGENFNGATVVHFGLVPASFTVVSDATITAISPPGTGRVDVTVTTRNGTSPITPNDQFTYVGAQTPIVTSISPTEGPESGGTTVTISGENFTGATFVNFGLAFANFVVVNNNTISAVSPPNSGTVDVTVTTPNGTSPKTPADQFTYLSKPLPLITLMVSPNPATVGQPITLTAMITDTAATGTVTFFEQSTPIGSATVVNGTAVFVIPSLAAGTYFIRAEYSGDATFSPAISPVVTLIVNEAAVPPPVNLQGFQRANRFATQTEYVNFLTWKAPKHSSSHIVEYKIYRNSRLKREIAVVSNRHHDLHFEDHNRKKGKTYTYFIVSVDRNGNISTPAKVKVRAVE